MEKVKVYNVDKYLIEQINKQSYNMDRAVIFVGDNGACIFDYEGCGKILKSDTEAFEIDLNDYIEDKRTVYIMPQYEGSITIKEIVDNAEFEEMELKKFMHKHSYNSRCISNFNGVLETINEIGLSASDYVDTETEN